MPIVSSGPGVFDAFVYVLAVLTLARGGMHAVTALAEFIAWVRRRQRAAGSVPQDVIGLSGAPAPSTT